MKEYKNSDGKSEPATGEGYAKLIIFSLIILFLQSAYGYIVYKNLNTWSDRGEFGEMFGAINTFFSGLAFAGVLYTIFLQRRELELTRQELHRTAEAQEKSEKTLSQQSDTLNEQAKALRLAAKLDTINTLIKLYNEQIPHADPEEKKELRAKKKRFHEELEMLVKEYSSPNGE